LFARSGFVGLALLCAAALPAGAQDAETGFVLPMYVTGGALYSHRMQGDNPAAGPWAGAFHAAFTPSIRLSDHWFAYASLHLTSTPFYYYDAFQADRKIEFHAIQAFLGYTTTYKSMRIAVKAGQLATAFGSFPLHYDDADNPLLDQPLSYVTYLKPTQSAAGSNSYGYTPVTLYGLPGIEVDLSVHNADARVQLTNSSPANPHNLLSGNQSPQWAAGGGYTVLPGLRIGSSVFRGPYLDRDDVGWLPRGTSRRNFPATGAGVDVQWARGRWSTSGEWQWFRFDYPGFQVSSHSSIGYAELKAILTPRWYAAVRIGDQRNGRVLETGETTGESYQPNVQSYEFAIGFRPRRWELWKVGYEWLRTNEAPGTRDNVLGVQLVTTLPSLSKAWR